MRARRSPRLDLADVDRMAAPAAFAVLGDGTASWTDGAVGRDDAAPRGERRLRFEHCRLQAVAIPPTCRELVLVDCRASLLDLAGTSLDDLDIRGSLLDDSRLSGVSARIRIEDVRLVGCQLAQANLRMARLERVELQGSRLESADLYGATLESVRFEDCDLSAVDLTAAELSRCEIARCGLAGVRGVTALAGTRISAADVHACALDLAVALGLIISDE